MRKLVLVMMATTLAVSMTGCGRHKSSTEFDGIVITEASSEVSTEASTADTDNSESQDSGSNASTADNGSGDGGNTDSNTGNNQGSTPTAPGTSHTAGDYIDWEELPNCPQEFVFSSGAGAWQTSLRMMGQGDFVADYSDTDAGDAGDEYPNGTVYLCHADGHFTNPMYLNDYSYVCHLRGFNTSAIIGHEEFRGGVRFINSELYGLSNADEVYIYTPAAPVSELPQTVLDWAGMSRPNPNSSTLDVYVLYSPSDEAAFVGY